MRKVSIIITTHSRPHLLPRAIESARLSGRDIEIVVVDDASTDGTRELCGAVPGIRYVRVEHNRRVAGARNIGLAASAGEYVSFLDDDDERLPDSVDRQVECLEAEPRAGMIYGQALVVDQRGAPTRRLYPLSCPQGDIFWALLGQNFIPCGSVVFRRSCLRRVGLLDEAVPGVDDWDLWVRVAECFPVIAVERPVLKWRQSSPGSGQGSSAAAELVRLSVRQFRARWMRLGRAARAPDDLRRKAWRTFSSGMASHLVCEAARAQAEGHSLHAAGNLFTALCLLPLAVLRLPFDGPRTRALLNRVGSIRGTKAV